jgi:two-component system, cell cycle response regulator DivK
MQSRSFSPKQTGSLGQPRTADRSIDPHSDNRRIIASAVTRAQSIARPTILVADDSDDSRDMLKTLLELKGYDVVEARDGVEALEIAMHSPLDLILIDLQLPELDGLQVTRDLRQRSPETNLPILVMSGHNPATHKPRALSAGCNEYLLKPIDFDLLEELLEKLIPATKPLRFAAPQH